MYISHKLFERLFAQGVQLITPIRKNMKNRLLPLMDKLLLRKRAIIETIYDQLKNISQSQLNTPVAEEKIAQFVSEIGMG